MPIKVQDQLPAQAILESENIFVMTEHRAMHQDIRPLSVLILNLMPTKIVTETQLLRKLSNTPLQIEVEFLQTSSHTSTHVDPSHLNTFYQTFDQVKDRKFDGMIITGAPLDFVKFEDVDYWPEICEILDWTRTHVHSVFHLCWGSFAALYHLYGIGKHDRLPKLSGIYSHTALKKNSPLFRGFDDVFWAPHSRATEVWEQDILADPRLELMATSPEAGVAVVKSCDNKDLMVMLHAEYDPETLALEFYRDRDKGMNPQPPVNYFPDDDPDREPVVNWRSTGQLLYTNWLNYYVYQTTPYDVERIE